MKNTLSIKELRRKNLSYYRKPKVVTPGRRKRSTIRYIVERSYDALPKKLKQYIEDAQDTIERLTQRIMGEGEAGKFEPYNALRQMAEYKERTEYGGTYGIVLAAFKEQEQGIWNHYNTYVYRLGYSATKLWYAGDLKQEKSEVTITVSLPDKASGIIYSQLVVSFDFSGQVITEATME